MALNLSKRNLRDYDTEAHTDISGSTCERDCPGNVSRLDYAKGWVETLVQEAEHFDDDGPTVGFFNGSPIVFENTTYDKVAGVFKRVSPGGGTDTARAVSDRINDYLDQRLGTPGTPEIPAVPKKGMFGRAIPAVPAVPGTPPNPKVKPRILLIITDGRPNSESALESVIIEATKRMSAGGLTKDDLVISFIQVGYDQHAKAFLNRLNNGLVERGATMDIVGCITCDQAMEMTTQQLLEAALDAE